MKSLPIYLILIGLYTTLDAKVIQVPKEHKTLQQAIDHADNGDTILVSDGRYTGTGNYNLNMRSDKTLTIKSENGPERCIIYFDTNVRNFIDEIGQNKITIDGITLLNGSIEKHSQSPIGQTEFIEKILASEVLDVKNCRILKNDVVPSAR